MTRVLVTDPPTPDPESGGPALTAGKVYDAKLQPPHDGGWAMLRDDEGYPYLLEPERFEVVDGQ